MNSQLIHKSRDINLNYAAKICRVDAIEPIPGANRLVRAVLANNKSVVSNDTKVGDIVVLFPCECCINEQFLRFHNLYDDFNKNANKDAYKSLRDELAALTVENSHINGLLYQSSDEEISAKIEQNNNRINDITMALKHMKGYFGNNGRVRMQKFRGEYSPVFVMPVEALEAVWPELKSVIWSKHLNEQFDMIGDDLLCWKYMPPIKDAPMPEEYDMPWYRRRSKRLKRFDRLIDGQFSFHYDTALFEDNIDRFSPFDEVDITVKVHGASVILANILTKHKFTLWEKVKRWFGAKIPETEYNLIRSSRNVILNRYINPGAPKNLKPDPIATAVTCTARDFGKYISPGMTVYGEMVGFVEGTSTPIQKKHDYGCRVGEWAWMPYRITMTDAKGNVEEWPIAKVIDWTTNLINMLEADNVMTTSGLHMTSRVLPMVLLYHGRLGDMYDHLYERTAESLSEEMYERAVADYKQAADYGGWLPRRLATAEDYVIDCWRTSLLETMKGDRQFLLMEEREPLCRNKVPREGVVIRKVNSTRPEAFKLKSNAHRALEQKMHDAGEFDMEESA